MPKGRDALEVFVGPGTLLYPNGIALSPDEKRLYVADLKHGLAVVDLSTKATRPLPHPASLSTAGIDGLYAVASDLVAVQNGAGRERVVRYWLDPEGEHIQKLEVMEARNPFFRIPTTGVVTSEGFVYLATPTSRPWTTTGTSRRTRTSKRSCCCERRSTSSPRHVLNVEVQGETRTGEAAAGWRRLVLSLVRVQVSTKSLVKTSPFSRKSWSFSRWSSTTSRSREVA